MPTDVTGTAGDQDALSEKGKWSQDGRKGIHTLRECFSVEGI